MVGVGGPAIVIREPEQILKVILKVILLEPHMGLLVVLEKGMEVAEGEATAGEVFAVIGLQIAFIDITTDPWGRPIRIIQCTVGQAIWMKLGTLV